MARAVARAVVSAMARVVAVARVVVVAVGVVVAVVVMVAVVVRVMVVVLVARDKTKFNSEVRVRCIIKLKELVKLELAFFFLTLAVHS